MARPEARKERELGEFAADVQAALGERLLCLVLWGSAAGDDWSPDRSDLNTAVVVPRVTLAVLEALAPVVARWRPHGFALPLVVDRDFLARAADAFPMELDDIRAQHRLLAGTDLFTDVRVDPAAVRRQCEHEARAKLLRLRTLYLAGAADPAALERLMVESLKSFLVILRHLLRLRGEHPGPGYADALGGGERVLGALPTLRALLARRAPGAVATQVEFGAYLAEVERIVAALDALDA